MAHYIDSDKLRAEIERRKKEHFDNYHINKNGNPADYGACNALTQLLSFLDTMQEPEVDLEKETSKELTKHFGTRYDGEITVDLSAFDITNIARHFYELGKNSK